MAISTRRRLLGIDNDTAAAPPSARPTPPGPAGRAFVGNLQDFDVDRLGFLIRAREDFGDLVRFDDHATIVNSYSLAKAVLQDPTGGFEVRENFLLKRLTPDGVQQVLEMRTLLNPGLRAGVVGVVATDAATTIDRQLASLFASVRSGNGAISLKPAAIFEQVVSEVVARYYFGSDGTAVPAACGRLLDALAVAIGNPLALPGSWPTPSRLRIKRRHRELHDLVVGLLARRASSPGRFADFATDVVRRRDPPRHSLRRTADLLIGSLLAAQRVPAAEAAWMLKLVAERPALQRELADEATGFHRLTATGETFSSHRFPLALAVVRESARMFPATWMLSRAATRSVTLGEYQFTAGHQFLISPYVIQRDPRYYDNPDEFRPSRFFDAPLHGQVWLAFGRGRHACPGADLATTTLVSMLLSILAKYRVDLSGGPVTPCTRTTLTPLGLRIRLTPLGGLARGRVPGLDLGGEPLPHGLPGHAQDLANLCPGDLPPPK